MRNLAAMDWKRLWDFFFNPNILEYINWNSFSKSISKKKYLSGFSKKFLNATQSLHAKSSKLECFSLPGIALIIAGRVYL